MVEYIIGNNPDGRIINKAKLLLERGELIIFPSDTNWVMACNPFSKKGVDAFYRARKKDQKKHFSLFINNWSQAQEVAYISDSHFRLLKNKVPGHYTFIFKATKKITKALKASHVDHQVGIRFAPGKLINHLLNDQVLMAGHIDPDELGLEDADSIYGLLLEEQFRSSVKMILDPGEYDFVGPSTIIDFCNEESPFLVREGAGSIAPFGL